MSISISNFTFVTLVETRRLVKCVAAPQHVWNRIPGQTKTSKKRGATIFQYKSRRRRRLSKECIPSESGGREDARVKELTILECVGREEAPVSDGLVFTLNHVVASKWPERSSLLPWHRPVPTDIYRWWSSKVLCDASTVGLPSTKTNAKLVETSGDLMTASLFVQLWYQHWPDFDLWSFSFTRSPAANLTFNFHLRLSLASPICLFNNKRHFWYSNSSNFSLPAVK